ncbi:TasA family protein [Halostagnicola sp. A-GB9-2]|uniref:TasA family protein n=1 Tax=Halostagnicola sp. A-GB9-2 TaxID=3048066 RepID=UPI0024BFE19F|nr:TasA family protein [Halostagnicola sp. A-GB9-2]MDJ1433886.1 TasA family protein [Halostagnicola sp. A-GB9-2]
MTKEIQLTRRKILASTALIGGAGATAGAGTWAFFSDEETSEGNTISAGTLELDVNEGDGFSYTWENAAPGDEEEVSVSFQNTGSIDAAELAIDTDVSGDEDLAEYIDLDLEYTNGDDPDGQTLAELADGELSLEGISAGEGASISIDATFNEGAGNDLQGASVEIDHTFTLRQEPGEDG